MRVLVSRGRSRTRGGHRRRPAARADGGRPCLRRGRRAGARPGLWLRRDRAGPRPASQSAVTTCVPYLVGQGCRSRVLMLTAAATIEDRVDGLQPRRRRLSAQTVRVRGACGPDPGVVPAGPARNAPGAGTPRPAAGFGAADRQPAAANRWSSARRSSVRWSCCWPPRAGWSRPKNCWKGCGTRWPTRSPPR